MQLNLVDFKFYDTAVKGCLSYVLVLKAADAALVDAPAAQSASREHAATRHPLGPIALTWRTPQSESLARSVATELLNP